MILTVTPNPALDLTYRTREVEFGESNRVPTALMRAGGKGVNVARTARQAGRDVLVVATVGGATGAEFRAELDASGLPAALVEVAGATRRSVTVVETDSGRTTVLNEHGAPLTPAAVDALVAAVADHLDAASCVVVSGSLPPQTDPGLPARIARLAAAVPCIVDTTGEALLAAARAGAVLKPNGRELAETTGSADAATGARRLLDLGAPLVVVSLGEEGMLAVDHHGSVAARLPTPLSGNPTGAGDAAVAALASALADGETDPRRLLTRAVAWSASAVLMPQAGELHPTYRDLEDQVLVESVA